MLQVWLQRYPDSGIDEQRLLNQKRSIEKNGLLTRLEIQRIVEKVNGAQQEMNSQEETTQETIEIEDNEVRSIARQESKTISNDANKEGNEIELMRESIMKKIDLNKKTTSRKQIRRITYSKDVQQLIAKANWAISTIETQDITELNEIAYATAQIIENSVLKEGRKEGERTPKWKQRLMQKIERLRRDVNKLVASKRNNKRVSYKLQRRYQLQAYDINHAIEAAKQHLTAISHRLQRYEARNEQFRINKLFQRSPKKVFKEFNKQKPEIPHTSPSREEVKEYWEEIWSKSVQHNEKATWINDLSKDLEALPSQPDIIITEDDVKHKLGSMANWKAPGPDKVQIFWLKKLTSLHHKLAHAMNEMLNRPEHIPQWLVNGRTVLIQKTEGQRPNPSEYRPITCLPTMWKVFSGILASKIMKQVNCNNILYQEQKGARPGARGTKDQLAIDRTITKDCKKRHTNLSMVWIDYRKAFDSVPHSWILKCLKLYRINDKIQAIIRHSMSLCKTTLTCYNKDVCNIRIRRGIFQGDALYPLLFCIAINPLSHILRKEGKEYALKNGGKINHLLYMDDLKLYSKKEDGINGLIRTVKIFSDDIRMDFGYDKCARLIINRGHVKETSGLDIGAHVIQDVDQTG
jgi:hypothetical protein